MIVIIFFFLNIFFFWDVVFHFVWFLPSKLWTPWRRNQTDDMSIMRMWHHPEMMLHYLISLTQHCRRMLNAEVFIFLCIDSSAEEKCLSAEQFRTVQVAVSSSIFCLQELQKAKVKTHSCWRDKKCVSLTSCCIREFCKRTKRIFT